VETKIFRNPSSFPLTTTAHIKSIGFLRTPQNALQIITTRRSDGQGRMEILQDSRTIRLKAFKRAEWYNISTEEKTCDCPDFQNGGRCERLSALGMHRLKPFIPRTHPTFSAGTVGQGEVDFAFGRDHKKVKSHLSAIALELSAHFCNQIALQGCGRFQPHSS
jgi:hypothetical protein